MENVRHLNIHFVLCYLEKYSRKGCVLGRIGVISHADNDMFCDPFVGRHLLVCPEQNNHNLDVISFAQHISAVYKSCLYNMRDLRRIRYTIDQTTACTIAIFLIQSKSDYSQPQCTVICFKIEVYACTCMQCDEFNVLPHQTYRQMHLTRSFINLIIYYLPALL